MKIVVLIKQVPDTETKIRIAGDGKHIEETSVTYVINPYDEFAIEAALQLVEKHGGEVTLLSLGSTDSLAPLRTGLAMGADKAILLKVADFRFLDSFSVASHLAGELQKHSWDLILSGKKAVDTDAEQVGSLVAMLLGIPVITSIKNLTLDGSQVTCQRDVEGGTETVTCQLPALLTCDKGLGEPRYPNLKGIMMAKKKPLDEVDLGSGGVSSSITALVYPPQKPGGRIIGEGAAAAAECARLLREEAKVI